MNIFSDNLLNGDAQRVAISGVTDTMLDMIAAFIASIIFSITYLVSNFIIDFINCLK